MGNFFDLHSLHRHDRVPEKTVRVEADVPGVSGMKWNRATANTDEILAADKMHTAFYKVESDTLVPFEFAKGPSPVDRQNLSHQFIIDVVDYLVKHDLTNTITIEVGDFTEVRIMGAVSTGELEVV